MYRILQRLKPCGLVFNSRSFSQGQYLGSKWNYVVYCQSVDVGKQVFEEFIISDFIENRPDWSAFVINDAVQGLANSNSIFPKLPHSTLSTLGSAESSNDIFARLGELTLKENSKECHSLLEDIRVNCVSRLTADDISMLIKEQHPKAILKDICTRNNMNFLLETRNNHGLYETWIYDDKGEKLFSVKNELEKEAERMACVQVLKRFFPEDFKSVDIDVKKLPLEEEIEFNFVRKQRHVSLTKSDKQSFGLTIQGGEKRVIRDKNHIQRHVITPIFISHIEKDSPADTCGLLVGDVLLSIGDHSLKNLSHNQAVSSLQKFIAQQNIDFIVSHDKSEMLKYQAEQRFLERGKDRIREEMSSGRMNSWHQAKSISDPEEYFLEKFEHKKRQFEHHKARKSIRLWDYPYKKK